MRHASGDHARRLIGFDRIKAFGAYSQACRQISYAIILAIVWAFLPSEAWAKSRPNVVLILIDDVSYMDLPPYGGEADMPTIRRFAAEGMRFDRYYTSPLCSPSRAMLLTGLNNHTAGFGTIPEIITDEQRGQPGYRLELAPGVTTVAEHLRQSGYRTYMSGKWHLGQGEGNLPNDHGFLRSIALDGSGADNWEQKPYMPYYTSADWFEDGEPKTLPEHFYSSDYLIDRMIEYITADLETGDPFFAYLPFQAIHIPIQAPRELTEKYLDTYKEGWDALRTARWQRAKELGLIAEQAPLGPMHRDLRSWSSLTDDEKRIYIKSMAVNAAMLEAMDGAISRLVRFLEDEDLYKDTIFIVTSDNGPEFGHPVGERGFGLWMRLNGYSWSYDNLGEQGSLAFIGPEWASAAAAPFSLFKFFGTEGGIRVPLIISGPGIAGNGTSQTPVTVTDITPTILDLTQAELEARDQPHMAGLSLAPVLKGISEDIRDADTPIVIEVSGNAAVLKRPYKITRNTRPYGDFQWRLYNIEADPGETTDLSSALPDTLNDLLTDYEAFVAANPVIEVPADFNVHDQLASNSIRRQLQHYLPTAIGLGISLLMVVGVIWIRRNKGRAVS